MRATLPLAALRTILHAARPSTATYTPVRALATAVDGFAGPSSSSQRHSQNGSSSTERAGKSSAKAQGKSADGVKRTGRLPRSRYVVQAPSLGQPKQKALRYSHQSSRVKGRTAPRPAKHLLSDEWKGYKGKKMDELGVKVYLPSVFLRLVRNTGVHADDPFTATFRCDLRLAKPDIASYLKNIYGLKALSIRTMNYVSTMSRHPLTGKMSRAGGGGSYKKVVITMEEPFWYPLERSDAWCNEHFERDRNRAQLDVQRMRITKGSERGRVGPGAKWRGVPLTEEQKEAYTLVEKTGSWPAEDVEAPGDGTTGQMKPGSIKRKKNVMKRKAEKTSKARLSVEEQVEQLRSAGW